MAEKCALWLSLIFVLGTVSYVDCQNTYDFIIVGAGAGGSVVARRLAESGHFKVLLVESGGLPREHHDVPALAPGFLEDPGVTFNFQSTPQKCAALQSNGIVSIVAGRMMGGSTSLNYMWFSRGHPRDYDNWAVVTGDTSWKYANMLKYLKRVENYAGDFPSVEHGYGGPIPVTRPRYSPGLKFWLEAGRELGYPVADPNGPQIRSFAPVEFNKRFGRRVSSFYGYLMPIMDRTNNLHVLMNTNVTRILFEGNRAVGVYLISNSSNYLTGSTFKTAFASKEIIISAGSYFSPALLQRSGIGPAELLKAANIPIIKDLPVGLNFQDHPAISLHFVINNASVVMDEERDLTEESWQMFNMYGDGPYSSVRGSTGQALISSSVALQEGGYDWPDLQLCMSHSTLPYVPNEELDMTVIQNLRIGETPMSSSIFLGRPRSRGSVGINPADPFGDPLINVGYLTDPRDLQIFLDGIRETLKTFEETHAYKILQPRYAPPVLPACDQFIVRSPEYWICYVGQTIQGGTHPQGTNKMGRVDDPTSVVDTELRVIGVEGLRVVDASVIPFAVNANPQAPVYAIAEKASDLILKRWGLPIATPVIAKVPPVVLPLTPEISKPPILENSVYEYPHSYQDFSNFEKMYQNNRKLHEKLFLAPLT